MIFYQIDAGGDRNFAYLMADQEGGTAALFDPPPDVDRYMPLVEKHGLTVAYVIITHGHSDHTWGVRDAVAKTGAKAVAYRSSGLRPDVGVDDGDTLELGTETLEFFHTPGHSGDAICILGGKKLVTGDTLFVGKVGGTGYGDDARQEYESLHRLMKLDDDIEVYPGHNYGVAPTSTIGHEKKTNPFILRDSFESFVELKRNWLQYKAEHGIP